MKVFAGLGTAMVLLTGGVSATQQPTAAEVFAGSELDNYLRYLQTLQVVPLHPWTLRAFSPAELDRIFSGDAPHPWSARYDFADLRVRPSLAWLAPGFSARINTSFPYGFNDGAIWAGRGLTVAAHGGFVARFGSLSLTFAPLAFAAQNADFSLLANGAGGNQAFGDGILGQSIDRPQRFGDGVYRRLDPGQSSLRFDWRKLAVGVSTANQYWGPASEFPVTLGNNAPGFPHGFLGSSRPIDLGPVHFHGRVIWGRLSQSAFSAETSAAGVRFATGIVLAVTTPELEIGFTRFSHQPWRHGGPSIQDALAMFNGGQGNQKNMSSVNQLASLFFRWVLPRSGFEVYGEYGRDDYSGNLRDFLLEPEHLGGFTFGFRKAVPRGEGRMLGVRAEIQSLQFSHLAQGRGWSPFYSHGEVQQGHTQLGQVLGSEAGVGGAGAIVALDAYSPRGRWTVSWTRLLRQQRGDPTGSSPDANGVDVQHAIAVERLLFLRHYELSTRVTGIYEINRDFQRDVFSLNLIFGLRRTGRSRASATASLSTASAPPR